MPKITYKLCRDLSNRGLLFPKPDKPEDCEDVNLYRRLMEYNACYVIINRINKEILNET